MATRKIRLDGDDVLRKVCKPIEKMTPRLQTLIDDRRTANRQARKAA